METGSWKWPAKSAKFFFVCCGVVSIGNEKMNSKQVLEREFFQIRAKILEIAASLDRIQRAEGTCDESRMQLIREGIDLIASGDADLAEKVQMLFSREYASGWRDDFGI